MRRIVLAAVAAATLLACHEGSDPSDSNFRSVRARGDFACGEREAGGEACWGAVHPELFGGLAAVATPSRASFTPRLRQVTRSDVTHGCGLEADGRAWCWGDNYFGMVGRREALGTPEEVAARPVDSPLRFRDIATDYAITCAVTLDGALYCWGDPTYFGEERFDSLPECFVWSNAPFRCAPVPIRITLDVPVERVVMGAQRACALTAQGEAWCWGSNADYDTGRIGVLGVGDDTTGFVPVPRPVVGGLRFEELQLFTGVTAACGTVRNDGPYCWGGRADVMPVDEADRERAATQPTRLQAPDGTAFTALAVGAEHACALGADRRAWCWGANGRGGALGNASTIASATPVRVLGDLRFERLTAGVGFTCGVAGDGAWCWGANGAGQLGDGGRSDQPIPVRVAGQGAVE